ncbi:MAG TPA: hypothetical protein VHO70_14995 [Chitinispirillaceae bacterium]|nr:hypothetical protein [Chitinispirillaceae bacterium]
MEQCFKFNQITRLHLQSVIQACKKAIIQFSKPENCYDNHEFLVSTSCQNTVYSWIDNKLFSGALAIMFLFLKKHSDPQSPISLVIGNAGTNTCQLLISSGNLAPFNNYAEPVSLTSTELDITELESFQYIMDMHGSYMQLWRNRDTHEYAFEIDFLCICKDKVLL